MAHVSHSTNVTEPSPTEAFELVASTLRVPVVVMAARSLVRLALSQRTARARSVATREQRARGTTTLRALRWYHASEQAARRAGWSLRLRAASKGRRRRRLGVLAVVLGALIVLLMTAPAPGNASEPSGAGQSSEALYVALGDSVATGVGASSSYVDRLYTHYQSALGVTRISNRAVSGATSGSLRTSGQLDNALADINAASDTRAVTIDIGGNDRGECASRWASCPFRDNLSATLYELRAALREDPGTETFVAMAYYNPASGLGGDAPFEGESWYDKQLLGTDLEIKCEVSAGPEVGINDVIFQEAGRRGADVADPYHGFKQGGQDFMADSVHPNDAGHAAIADAFREAKDGCAGLPDPPPAEPASNEFRFGKVERNRKRGTAKLTVVVPGPGELILARTRRIEGAQLRTDSDGDVKLPIKPKRVPGGKLNENGRARVRAEVTYTPDDGEPNTQTKRVTLVRRR